MSGKVFIPLGEIRDALDRMGEGAQVWVPALSGDNGWAVEFRRYGEGVEPVLDRLATMPPKKIILPQAEQLLSFRYDKDPGDPSKQKIVLEPPVDNGPAIVFGARPCDVRGFLIFDRVFLQGPYQDPIYRRKRENTLFATFACDQADNACFCSATGGGPADTEGSDIRITRLPEGFLLEALTERATAIVDAAGKPAGKKELAAAKKIVKDIAARKIGSLDTKGSIEDFRARFQDAEFWRNAAGHCLSCGACTYACPTCYCFTITDESKELKGERLRSWDSCMFSHYTQEASGHNPRPTKMERYRNRVGHKFSYIPERYDGIIGCCGCGRCVRSCPASVDIRAVVSELKEKTDACA